MKKWDDLPKSMRNNSVKKYYDILKHKKISLFFKRLFDIVFSIIGLIILSPLFLIISVAIKLDSRGPIFFRQERVTRYDKTFRIFKFRTMIQNADKKGSLVTVKDDNRITRIGKLIRKCRLDEIPQLINILKGDMSFVGTRPEVRKYVDKYTDEMMATLLLRAGVTSDASISYKDEDLLLNKANKNTTNIDNVYVKEILPQKMKINLKYIYEFGLVYDLKVICRTVKVIIRR